MKTLDLTNGKKPTSDQEISLTVEFKSGTRYVFYGSTKKEATKKYIQKFGDFKGIVKKEWQIV